MPVTFSRFSRFAVLSAGCALAAVRLAAQGPAVSAVAAPAGTATVVTYIQLAAPQALARDIMGIARQVAPGMQTEMVPLIVLGKYGYPTFPGVASDTPIIVLAINSPAGQGVVAAANIAANSSVLTGLATFKLPMQTDPVTGWTFLSNSPEILNYALAHAADFVKTAGSPITSDLVWTLPTSDLSFLRDQFSVLAQAQAKAGGAGLPPGSDKWVDFAFQELQQLQFIRFSLDLKPDVVSFAASAAAQPGTPVAAFFSAPVGGSVSSAQYISAGAPITVVVHDNMPAMQAFADHVFADAQTVAGPGGQQILTQVQKVADAYFLQSDGTAAEALAESPAGGLQVQTLAGGNNTNASIVQLLQAMYPQLAMEIVDRLNSTQGNLLLTNISLNLNSGNISSLPVHQVISRQSVNPAALAAPATAKQAGILAALPAGNQTTNIYVSAVNGYYAQSTSLPALTALVQAVQAGQPVPDNLGSKFTLAPGQLAMGQINLGEAMADVLDTLNGPGNTSAPASNSSAVLRSGTLAPLTFSATRGANQAQMTFSIPVATFVNVVQAAEAQMSPPPPVTSSNATTTVVGSGPAPGTFGTPPAAPTSAPAAPAAAPGN